MSELVQSSNRKFNEMLAQRMAAEDALAAEVARLTALLLAAQGDSTQQLTALQESNAQLQSHAAQVGGCTGRGAVRDKVGFTVRQTEARGGRRC